MNHLNTKEYVIVKDKRYKFHPTENNKLFERKEPNSLGTQKQAENETKI